jgi:DNA repair exonuclease SbcCD ATPase subunit
MIVDRDKEIHEIELKSTKAADLVAEVQPENIAKDVKKFDIRVEALKSGQESLENINERIISELKEVRNSIRAFKGVEEIQKITKELTDDQIVMRKIEGKVEQHAEKTESIYVELSKKFEDYKRLKELAESISQGFKGIESEFNEFKKKYQNIASKEEELGKIDQRLSDVGKSIEDVKYMHTQLEQTDSSILDLAKKTAHMEQQIKSLMNRIDIVQEENINIRKNVEKNFKEDNKRTKKLEKLAEMLSLKQKADIESFRMTEKRLLNYAIKKSSQTKQKKKQKKRQTPKIIKSARKHETNLRIKSKKMAVFPKKHPSAKVKKAKNPPIKTVSGHEQKLYDYIASSRKKGMPDEQIEKNLLSVGWKKEIIKRLLKK